MAYCIRFVCSDCRQSIEAWDDGNPFYIDESGSKTYAYHPNHNELAKCIANDVPHLCLKCESEVKIDSRLESKVCPECRSRNVVNTCELEGVKCPKCEDRHFVRDKDFFCIS
jgi:DNA-directed RNA polymerase subunit RPC12/RpoP